MSRQIKPKRKLSKRTVRGWLYGYMFLLPWLVGVFLLVLYPLLNSFNFGLNSVRITPKGMVFNYVGLKNYYDLWVLDTNFLQTLINFLISTLLQTPIIVAFSLIISMMLNQKIKLRGLFRSIFFLPVIIATGPVMNELVNEGVATVPMMNSATITATIGTVLPSWLASPIVSIFSSLIIILWNAGVQILIFLAGLQKVDHSLYEAAKIDGGSAWECFWKITIPTIKPMIFLNAVYTIVWLSTGGQNTIINLIYDSMYNASQGYGYASAEAWMYSVIILLLLGAAWLLLHEKKEKIIKVQPTLEKRGWR